jgi:hypothetical protein
MRSPSLPEAYRSVSGLGALQDYFPIRQLNRWGGVLFLGVLLAAGAAVLAYGVYEAYVWSQRYGPALIDDKLTIPLLLASALFLLAMLVAWTVIFSWNKSVALYERGFVARDRKGFQTWRWEDVTRLYAAVTRHYANGIYTGTSHVYTLVDAQGKRLVLNDSYARVEELGKLIDQKTLPILYERASGQYNAGHNLPFDRVTISKSGIQVGKKAYPWGEIEQVSVRRGILRVAKKDGSWFSGASAPVSAIPNLRVLLSMIDQIVGIKTA